MRNRQAARPPLCARPLTKGTALVEIIPLSDIAPDRVEALLDAAFGADRFGRTAYRLREGTAAIDMFSFAAVEKGRLVGSIQCWPVALFGTDGTRTAPLVLVGPVAVHPERQRGGIGRMLMDASLRELDIRSDGALMMIGDPEYYGRFFGFSAEHTGRWSLPGPWEPHRLLAHRAGGQSVPDAAGMIGPDPR